MRCLSCYYTGHDTSMVLQLFKLACLQYTPNKVKYRTMSLGRTDVLTLRKVLWEKLLIAGKRAQLFKTQ